jgi:tricarballylate dehydrogenase
MPPCVRRWSRARPAASVLLLEAAPREWRGGNSVHTRNLRCMHDAPQDVLTEAYPEEEFWQDLLKVTGGLTDEPWRVLRDPRARRTCRDWMRRHGVRFQPSLSGTLHLSRTNAFFMGGGKALVNAYYRSAEVLGVAVRYETPVQHLELDGGRFVAAHWPTGACRGPHLRGGQWRLRVQPRVAARGLGQNERGEWTADNFAIRGTRFNRACC